MATISTSNLLTQSPYLILQAAGSDGADGSVAGIHLRWDLLDDLGNNHIPKGDLANSGSPYYTTAGFSKQNDYVNVFRSEYTTTFPATVSFNTAPSQTTETAKLCQWKYNNLVPVAAVPSEKCNVIIRFTNTSKYLSVRATVDPAVNPLGFIQQYDDLLEAEVEGHLLFAATVNAEIIDSNNPSITRVEAVSVTGNDPTAEKYISCKKKFENEDFNFLVQENKDLILQEDTGLIIVTNQTENIDRNKVIADNIKYIRFKAENAKLTEIRLEAYYFYISGINNTGPGWTSIGQFGLSLNDSEVYERLENSSTPINGLWPKYNGSAKVNIPNYQNRWLSDPDGPLKAAIISYLALSTDPDNLGAEDVSDLQPVEGQTNNEQSKLGISFLDMIKLISMDYHVARMLGMGNIDTSGITNSNRFIYISTYNTLKPIAPGQPSTVSHASMTIPTGKKNQRLPLTPVLEELSYGIRIDNGTNEPELITDEQGYSKADKSRYINLNVVRTEFALALGPFFVPDEEFDYTGVSDAVFYGVEYNKQGESTWRSPEISFDPVYNDTNGIPETAPIPSFLNPVYTHQELENGIHKYGVYAINWFSRPSELSNIRTTDNTFFKDIINLVPPLNLAAQVIQKEDVLIFTTTAEQEKLAAIQTSDKTLVRATFDWNHIHNINYWYADKAEFFFRQLLPLNVRGEIKSVTEINNNEFEVRTRSYVSYSTSPATVIAPVLSPSSFNGFAGSFFAIGDKQYVVNSIAESSVSGEGPIFTLLKVKETQLFDLDNSNKQLATKNIILPAAGDRFYVIENLSAPANWDTQLAKSINLVHFSDHTETVQESDGTWVTHKMGGIIGNTQITEKLDIEGDEDGNPVEIPGSHTGVFDITFSGNDLAPHPDQEVEWYKGNIRIKTATGEVKTLEILSIDNTDTDLKLVAYDATFAEDEFGNLDPSYIPIQTGSNVWVNFHPGYRVYFYAENGFDQNTIYPASGEGSRQTFLSARSKDNTKGFTSYLTAPVVLMAREIIEPKKPETPQGPLFATRPDVYNKSTYTFDTVVDNPYSLMFLRANDQTILDSIYKPETVLTIYNDLAALGADEFFTSRWNELVNLVTDEGGLFREINGYRFPNPDNDAYVMPNPNLTVPKVYPFKPSTYGSGIVPNPASNVIVPGTVIPSIGSQGRTFNDLLSEAILNAFLPLTEQPVIFQYIKSGTQTRNTKPVLRDSNQEPLLPGDPAFDQAPMAVKTDYNKVRFTDYSLDGASKNFYFYYAQEISNRLTLGPPSDVLGPIKLLNTAAPDSPQIVKVVTQVDDPLASLRAAIKFEINPYVESQQVKYIRIYRALNAADASSVRTMSLATTIAVGDEVIDTFSDLDFTPYGDTLFYRIAAVREIINEFDEIEEVTSLPSSLVLTNIIDVANPMPPEISYEGTPDNPTDPSLISDVTLEWGKTAHNGTYYLYQMSSSGNWTKIDQIKSNDNLLSINIGDLAKKDDNGEPLFYRYKVNVENASGLLNTQDFILTI